MTGTTAPPHVTANSLEEGLRQARTPQPCALVIFGATGDLTKRKLVPAIYALAADGLLPPGFTVVGSGRTDLSDEEFRNSMREGIRKHSRLPFSESVWRGFEQGLRYVCVDLDGEGGLESLRRALEEVDRDRGTGGNRIFYLSIPPSGFADLAERLGREGMSQETGGRFRRLIVEKPFGRDLSSARKLNEGLHTAFGEEQIYRIDHYLGKETVQNLLVFRFANGIFEPLWNRQYVDHIQITVAESIGVEGRRTYYEESGALRDIVQSHIMQLVAIVGMEAPADFRAETVRDEKVKLLRAVRPIHPDDVREHTVRGQYGSGWVEGQPVPAYREEPGGQPDSLRETFVALKAEIDNWRWAGTPFYLRTGKRLAKRATEIAIQFRHAPHSPFDDRRIRPEAAQPSDAIDPNLLILRIQPDEGITMRFSAKVPGQSMRIRTVNMDFLYGSSFMKESPEAYERLLLDCMLGDPTLFAREDEVEEAWRFCTAILDGWRAQPPDGSRFPNYEAGTWGPEEAHGFMARDGRNWRRL